MSEHSHGEQKEPITEAKEVVYHWNYAEQLAFDRESARRTRKKGTLTYALITAGVFLACLIMLFFVILWYGGNGFAGLSYGENGISETAERVTPATVLIYADKGYSVSYGTGFFLTSDGYIATNHHVVSGATSISVRLYDGELHEAKFINGSSADDLAVLKIDGIGYADVMIGNSDSLSVGDTVIAIGNPSGDDAPWSVTHGIVSALDRTVSVSGKGFAAEVKMLQTDAPLNNGNSGGPLCNTSGEVIGVVSRKLSDTEGIGFALPINEAIRSLSAMISGTYRQSESTLSRVRPLMGVTVQNIAKGTVINFGSRQYTTPHDGLYVQSVTAGSGCDGILENGDVIYEMDGVLLTDVDVLQQMLYRYNIGDEATLKIDRLGEEKVVSVRLGVAE